MNLSWKRTLRTASSERFLAQREGKDVAAVDLHYLANGTVAGTVILLKEAGWQESDVPALLGWRGGARGRGGSRRSQEAETPTPPTCSMPTNPKPLTYGQMAISP
jgi:hypothetical protein